MIERAIIEYPDVVANLGVGKLRQLKTDLANVVQSATESHPITLISQIFGSIEIPFPTDSKRRERTSRHTVFKSLGPLPKRSVARRGYHVRFGAM